MSTHLSIVTTTGATVQRLRSEAAAGALRIVRDNPPPAPALADPDEAATCWRYLTEVETYVGRLEGVCISNYGNVLRQHGRAAAVERARADLNALDTWRKRIEALDGALPVQARGEDTQRFILDQVKRHSWVSAYVTRAAARWLADLHDTAETAR